MHVLAVLASLLNQTVHLHILCIKQLSQNNVSHNFFIPFAAAYTDGSEWKLVFKAARVKSWQAFASLWAIRPWRGGSITSGFVIE